MHGDSFVWGLLLGLLIGVVVCSGTLATVKPIERCTGACYSQEHYGEVSMPSGVCTCSDLAPLITNVKSPGGS